MRYGIRGEFSGLRLRALQLGAWPKRLHMRIRGPFAQKGHRDATRMSEAVAREAQLAAGRSGWKPIPRARVAVEMRFFSKHAAIPALHNLVKAYLDPLRGIAFADDRQVGCLVAVSWRPPPPLSNRDREEENSVFITVERFADCVRRFDACHALLDNTEFRDANNVLMDDENESRSRSGWNDDEQFDDRWLQKSDLPEETRAGWRRMNLTRLQEQLLAGNRIGWRDRPGGAPPRMAPVGFLWRRQAHPLRFGIDLPGLPGRGESDAFRAQALERVRAVSERWRDRGRLIVPVELDVQVPEQPGPTTDLDNVMRRYVAPAITGELLSEPDSYLHGYRIYRVKQAPAKERPISVKVMSQGAIQRFEELMDKISKAAEEWLRTI